MPRIISFLTLAAISTFSIASEVPGAFNTEILGYLKKQQECRYPITAFDVHSVIIGPHKRGYIGVCSGTEGLYILYEETETGLVKLLNAEWQMHSDFAPSTHVNKGYFDMVLSGQSGSDTYVKKYRWNGHRYQHGIWKIVR